MSARSDHHPVAAAPHPDGNDHEKSPTMDQLLAACAAATAISTPPGAPRTTPEKRAGDGRTARRAAASTEGCDAA